MRPKTPTRRRDGGAPDLHAAESAPRAVAALADSFVRGVVIPAHSHARAQLIYAVQGTMSVRASGCHWILPPSHALWVPGGVVHEITMNGPVEMRTLYIKPRTAARVKRECQVLFVSPLLRELIVRAMAFPMLYDERGTEGRVIRLILEEIATLPKQPLGLRMPGDARLLRLCELVLSDLSSTRSIRQLGAAVGLSERSVIRLFPRETGLSFGRWQMQARLLKAFELFDRAQSVTRVALDLGYSGPSAFAKMFRRAIGKAPTSMLPSRVRA